MRNTSQLRQVWAPACNLRPHHVLTFWNGVRVTIDGRCADAFRALDAILKQWGYRPKSGETWGYNCRKITGGTGYSLHAYGIAVDINSLANPYGPRLITDMPPDMTAAVKAIKTTGGHRVFGWGGDYGRNKDAMHFEVVASPAELETGIDWSTVEQIQISTPTPKEEDDMTPDQDQVLRDAYNSATQARDQVTALGERVAEVEREFAAPAGGNKGQSVREELDLIRRSLRELAKAAGVEIPA